MADGVDVLFINRGDGKQIDQGLGNEFSAIKPPVFAGLFITYVRQKGHGVAIYDASAMMAEKKFGQDAFDDCARMVSISLSRKLLEERTAA